MINITSSPATQNHGGSGEGIKEVPCVFVSHLTEAQNGRTYWLITESLKRRLGYGDAAC
jgi:hypothetical protein